MTKKVTHPRKVKDALSNLDYRNWPEDIPESTLLYLILARLEDSDTKSDEMIKGFNRLAAAIEKSNALREQGDALAKPTSMKDVLKSQRR